MNTFNNLSWPYVLRKGHSNTPSSGACALDAINWLVHGKHGDEPECVDPIIANFVICANDNMDDVTRQKLVPFLHRIAGSRYPNNDSPLIRERIMIMATIKAASRAAFNLGMNEESRELNTISFDTPYYDITPIINKIRNTSHHIVIPISKNNDKDWDYYNVISLTNRAVHFATEAQFNKIGSYCAAALAYNCDDLFIALNDILNAGPQGEPWSADQIEIGLELYQNAHGKLETIS